MATAIVKTINQTLFWGNMYSSGFYRRDEICGSLNSYFVIYTYRPDYTFNTQTLSFPRFMGNSLLPFPACHHKNDRTLAVRSKAQWDKNVHLLAVMQMANARNQTWTGGWLAIKQIFPGLCQNTWSPESGCYRYTIGILNFSNAKLKCRNAAC